MTFPIAHARLRCGLRTALAVGLSLASAGHALATPSPAPSAPCQESIPALYKRVSPAVVSIAATAYNPYDTNNPIERHSGSGVVFDPAGLVLTNAHVVVGHQVILVTLDDGTTLPGLIVGADPLFDIAVVRIPKPAVRPLPVARLGNSDLLQVGEEVYVIGNPFGLDQTLTRGIVSAVNRILPGAMWSLREPLIQTDAAINPGNSGGPLVNRCGEVVGITTAILPEAQSIGFAVPASLIQSVIPDLLQKGRVVRPWLGVQGQLISATLKGLVREALVDGFLVELVEPDSPAGLAGIQGGALDLAIAGQPVLLGGDVITQMDGAPVTDVEKLNAALGKLKVGGTVRLTLYRDQKSWPIEIVVAERPGRKADVEGRHALAPAARAGSGAQPVRAAF
jgi:S1-C subfamily serine protease